MLTIEEHIPLAPLTTFKIGGPARFYVKVRTEEDVREAVFWARSRSVPLVAISGGSNVLIPDDGLEALVLHMVSNKWMIKGSLLEADAGCVLTDLIRATAATGLGGWEKLAGIPGSLGGAVRGNAGAFGPEIKDFVDSVRALNVNTLEPREWVGAACEFAYRSSFFKKHPEWIIVAAKVSLKKGVAKEYVARIEETIQERERRHIQNVRAAGSYFMNPVAPEAVRHEFEKEKNVTSREGRVPAGWLIEKVGLKGASEGSAQASDMHPNYLVNTGEATAKDVKALARRIKDAVRERFQVELKEEAVVF